MADAFGAQFLIYPWFFSTTLHGSSAVHNLSMVYFSSFCLRPDADSRSAALKIGVNHATGYVYRQKL